MIVHRIDPHKYVAPPPNIFQRPTNQVVPITFKQEPYELRVPLGDGYLITKINQTTNKLVYTQWLSSLGFRRGDYVVHRRTYDSKMIRSQFNYLRVVQLQEVHMLLDFADNGKAKALELVAQSGTRFWTCPDEWVKEAAPAEPSWHFDVPQP